MNKVEQTREDILLKEEILTDFRRLDAIWRFMKYGDIGTCEWQLDRYRVQPEDKSKYDLETREKITCVSEMTLDDLIRESEVKHALAGAALLDLCALLNY